jgi:excinuclease ABC subunit B
MAEDLAEYLREVGVKSRYLHSDITTIERVEILRGLRKGDFDVLIGINLLREGLDLVEVSLVAILDADKEGFLRSTRSLIQTMGRAARNVNGRVVMYGDTVTGSMREAIEEAERRRRIQAEFNRVHGITPRSAKSLIQAPLIEDGVPSEEEALPQLDQSGVPRDPREQQKLVEALKRDMFDAAAKREFERAAQLRDRINEIQRLLLAS